MMQDGNKARRFKAKTSKPRPRPETCKVNATHRPKAKAENTKVNFRANATVLLIQSFNFE